MKQNAELGKEEAGSTLIRFEPDGTEVEALANETLLDCARRAGVEITSACGGRGICKSCVVKIENGEAPAPSDGDRAFFSENKLGAGWRRACQCSVVTTSSIKVPKRSRVGDGREHVDGVDVWIAPDPAVKTCRVVVDEPNMVGSEGDGDRLMRAVNERFANSVRSVAPEVLEVLPQCLQEAEGSSVQVVHRLGEVISVQPPTWPVLGLAVDLGTTNIGVFVVNLNSGMTVAASGFANPQREYGADLVARVGTAKNSDEARIRMGIMVQQGIRDAVIKLCKKKKLPMAAIVDVVIAGNTIMHHLFLGLSVAGLGLVPFVPVTNAVLDNKAHLYGLSIAPGAYLHMMANIAGYVGADHTAMLLGIRADTEERTVVALDIGTNTEISLIHKGEITSLSCPSGPALEGGNISCGMRAADGAIEGLRIKDGKLQLKVIGNETPVGLCGSAVLDAAAQFYDAGDLTQGGQIVKGADYVSERDGQVVFELALGEEEVVFTQKDVRNLQLAKGAIAAGIEVLLRKAGLVSLDLDKVVIAGAFGAYIDIQSAITIGMLPCLPIDRFEQVGNAAGAGTKLALLSHPMRVKAATIAKQSTYVEMAGTREFMTAFVSRISFPALATVDLVINESIWGGNSG